MTTATATGAALSNYTVTYVAGTFSITPATATVTAASGTKGYGTADPALDGDGDRLHRRRCADDRAHRDARAGETVGELRDDGDGDRRGAQQLHRDVRARHLQHHAGDGDGDRGSGTKVYGTADPALTATATGFTAADALTIALTATRAAGETVGDYVTTATATGAALSNYTVTYVAGTFSITPATATVTAASGTKGYGTADPTLAATATGFTAADALTIALTATRAAGETVGEYATTRRRPAPRSATTP